MIKKYFIAILVSGLFVSCKSQKNKETHAHSHDENVEAHVHEKNNYFDSYSLVDKTYGTKTIVTVKASERKMVTNALPNHKTGEFPNSGNPNTISAQNRTYTFPINPKYTGKSTWVREPGVALNGVKFEPGTAEVVVCETGENYRVEALQALIDLGLDSNHAHVQPTGAYHYHGTPTSVIEKFDTGKDLVHIGFAHDGFPMYYSKSGKYKPSFKLLDGTREGEDCAYKNPKETIDISVGGHHDGTFGADFEYVANSGDLDECNGIAIDGKYMYLVTNEFPYVSRCLMGEVTQQERKGPSRDQQQGGKPSFYEILKMMDTNKDSKVSKAEAKGPLSENFDRIDKNKDGFLTKEELGNVGQRQGQRVPKHN
ncbi:YHYH protein [Polaribacter sp. NJDZ03]|uniref:YHYH protein n=1 Tax=Polaribacter sp. NJDZ03 TaxID=2855841 RepID=UPI001C4A1D56|nr:YHYH protein [Polaribacter sp. NJDZ03]